MPHGVRRLVTVIKAVPRLQAFVSDVCKVPMFGAVSLGHRRLAVTVTPCLADVGIFM